MSGDQQRADAAAEEYTINVFFGHDKNLILKAKCDHGGSVTVGELVALVKEECQHQIPADMEFNAYPEASNRSLSQDEAIPADLHLRLIAKGLERQHTRLYETEGKIVSAIPLPAFIRQEAKNFSILDNLLELIDNAISATWRKNRSDRYEPRITVKLLECTDDPAKAELIVEDNGTGIERHVLEQILVSSFSFSAGPPILARSHMPLPLERYINRHFNRYGRGLHALFFFGDLITIESKVPGAVQGNKLVADFKEWQEAHSRKDEDQYKCKISTVHVISGVRPGSESGETCVKIARLRPEVLSMLRNAEVQQWLQKQVASVYHLHLHGMDKDLFDRLPGSLRQNSARPRPTVTMNVLGVQMGRGARGQIPFGNDSKPPILKMAETTSALYGRHPFIKPFVLCARFEPKELEGKAPTGEGLDLDEEERARLTAAQATDVLSIDDEDDPVAQQQKATEQHWREVSRKAAAREPPGMQRSAAATTPVTGRGSSGRGGRGRGTPHLSPKGTPAAGGRSSGKGSRGGSSSGRGGGRAGSSSSSQRASGAHEGPEARQALREEREQQEHRGPLSVIDHEQERKPAYIDLSCILDYYVQEDGQPSKPNRQLGAIPIWSGRVLPDEHSAALPDFVAAARELCRTYGVSFYNRLDAERIGGLLLISPECQAAIHKNRATDPAYDALLHLGSSLINEDEDRLPDLLKSGNMYVFNYFTNRFELDNNGELAARMLMHHFTECWTPLDDVGTLVNAITSLEDNGTYITRSIAWKPPASMRDASGKEVDPLRAGEMVRVLSTKELATDEVKIGSGDAHAAPCNFFMLEEFTQLGTDQPLARIKQWRPNWSDPANLGIQSDSVPVLRIRPLAASTAQRDKDAESLIRKFESDAPHHVAYKKGKSGQNMVGTLNHEDAASLSMAECTFTTTHSFNEVQLLIVSPSNKAAKDPKSKWKDVRLTKSGKSLNIFQPTVTATLTDERGKKVWEQPFVAPDGVNVCVEGFHARIKREGDYELRMVARDALGILDKDAPPLCYRFSVVSAHEPPRLEASWSDSQQDAWPRAVAGETLPPLRLSHMRGSRLLPMPHASDWSALKDNLHVTLELHGKPSSSGSSGGGSREQAEEEEDADTEEQPSKRRRKTKAKPASSLRLTRAEIVPAEDGSVVLKKVEVPHAVLACSPDGYKVACQDFQVSVTVMQPAARGDTEVQPLSAAPLMLTVVSGAPAEIRGGIGNCEQGVSKGFFVPEIVLSITDKHGAPWHNPAAATKRGPKKFLKKKGAAQEPALPHAILSLHNCIDRLAGSSQKTSSVIAFDGSEIEIDEGRFCVTGPAGTSAQITFTVNAQSLGVPAAPPLEHTFDIPISRVHITFGHPELRSAATRGRDTSAEDQGAITKAYDRTGTPIHGAVDACYVLDMLPYAKDLWEHVSKPEEALPQDDSWARHKQVHDGLEVRAPDILVAPSGRVYRGSRCIREACTDLARAQEQRIYEPVIMLGPSCTEVQGVRIQITDWSTDGIDRDFCSPFKVLIDGKDDACAGAIAGSPRFGDENAKQPEEGYLIPPMDMSLALRALQPRTGQPVRHTVPIKIVDDADDAIVYGTVYVRQTPIPVAVSLLPLGHAFQQQLRSSSSSSSPGMEATLLQRSAGGERSRQGWLRPPASAALTDGASSSTAAAASMASVSGWAIVDKVKNTESARINWWHDRVSLETPLCVRAKQAFEVHFLLLDQHDVPIKASENVQQHIPSTARAVLMPKGAAVNKRSMLARIVGNWAWNQQMSGAGMAQPLPVHSVMVEVTSGLGEGELSIISDDVRVTPGAACTATLSLSFKVQVNSGPIAADGVRLSSTTPGTAVVPLEQQEVAGTASWLTASALLQHLDQQHQQHEQQQQHLQQLRSLLPQPEAHREPCLRACKLHACDGGMAVSVQVALLDATECPVGADGVMELIALSGWLPNLEVIKSSSVRQTPGSSALRLQFKHGTATFSLKVPRGAALCARTPQRLLMKPLLDGALPVLLELALEPGAYPTQLAISTVPALLPDWGGEPLIFEPANHDGPGARPMLPKIEILALTANGEGVPATALAPLVPTMRARWQRHVIACSTQEGGTQDEAEYEEFTSEQLPLPTWVPSRSCAVFDGSIAVPVRSDAYRLVFSAEGVPDVCTHFIEVVPGLPLGVADIASDTIRIPSRMPLLPLDYEGRQLQVVTRAQLAPKGLGTPRVSATVHDGHGNGAYLPVGTRFEMLVVQENQGQEWVVACVPVTKDEGEGVSTEVQASCKEWKCHFAPIDLHSLRQKAEELAEASEVPLDFSDGCVYAVRVRARLPGSHPTTQRCAEEAGKQAIGLTPAPRTRMASSTLHASTAGSGWRGEDWVLHTLTLVSFVVASAEDEELRRKQARLRSALADFKGEKNGLVSAKAAADRSLAAAQQKYHGAVAELHASEARVSNSYGLSAPQGAPRGRSARLSAGAAPASTPLNAAQLVDVLQRRLEKRQYKQVPLTATGPTNAADTSGRSSRKSSRHQQQQQQQQQLDDGHEAEGSWEAEPVIAPGSRSANILKLQEARDILESSPNTPSVLGPLALLLSCEREDTARALSSYLGANLFAWIAVDSKDADTFYEFLKSHHGKAKVLGLQDPSVGFAIPDPVDEAHPQRPLVVRSQAGVEEALDTDRSGKRFGFVGYACNLVAIPPAFDNCLIIPDGALGHSGNQRPMRLTLRQALGSYFFRKLMVFETAAGWMAFKSAMERAGHPLQRDTKLIGLDGTRYNLQPGMREAEDAKAAPPQVMLGGVPASAQLKAPLDARVKQLSGDISCLKDACEKEEQTRAAVSEAEASQQRAGSALAEFRASRGPAQAQAQQEFDRVQEELQRIQSAKRASGAQSVQQQQQQQQHRAQQQRAEAQAAMGSGLRQAKRGSAGEEEASRKQQKRR